MGKGNIAVGIHDGLYYVDYDHLYVYHHKDDVNDQRLGRDIKLENFSQYQYDEILSNINMTNFIDTLEEQFRIRFPSFVSCSRYEQKSHVIAENHLYMLALEDNEWSIAVELLAKENNNLGLQKHHFPILYDQLKYILLTLFPEIHTRIGPWTSRCIKREDTKQKGLPIHV